MAFLIGEISANVRADSTQFRREMSNVQRTGARTSRRTERSLGGIGRKLSSLAFLAKTAFVSSMVMGARTAVREFAQLEGAMAKFNVVFGNQAREVEAWVNEFREGVPLARREIIAAAASMQDLLVPMGVARQDATEMTKEWLELAAALAAFNDVPVDQALEAIRSGIAGQSRPLRQFGIDVRETSLQQTALEEGLIRSGEAMSETVRQQALLTQAYRQSKDAIDGYEDQLDSTLIKEQGLGAQFKDTAAVIGRTLQPAYNSMVASMTRGLKIIEQTFGAVNRQIIETGRLLDHAMSADARVEDMVAAMSALSKAIELTRQEMQVAGTSTELEERLENLQRSSVELAGALANLASKPLAPDEKAVEGSNEYAESLERARAALEAMQGIEAPIPEIFDPAEALAIRLLIEEFREFDNTLYDVMKTSNDFSHRLENIAETSEQATGAARFFSRTLADGLDQVLFRARSVEDALQGIARQLASRALSTLLMGAFTGGFGGSFFGAMFGGFRSGGGSVQAGRAYRMNENNQQEMFMPSTNGQVVSPRQMQSSSINPAQMERAFFNALDKKLKALPPRAVYAMAEKGKFDY